jgi:hypothetical protein
MSRRNRRLIQMSTTAMGCRMQRMSSRIFFMDVCLLREAA